MKRGYNKLLDSYYKALDEENEELIQELSEKLHKKYGTNKHCFRCRNQLLVSDLKGYKYLCLKCDENFYGFETLE